MSGHSKWSTIKRKKGAADQKRGKEFSKLIRVITQAARSGGGDQDTNSILRTAVEKAKSINMPADTIVRAVKRGTGEIEGMAYVEVTYEGYGPGGIAIMVEALTDNKNRTTAEVRHMLSKAGGSLGENGCVMWMFDKKGLILLEAGGVDEEKLMDTAIEGGADEVFQEGEFFSVTCAVKDLESLKDVLQKAGYKVEEAKISMEPQTTVKVEGKQAESIIKLMNLIEDNEDVQNVYANFDIPDDVMAGLEE